MVLQTEFAQIKNNNLYIDDVKATELAKKYGTPLYVMSEGHICLLYTSDAADE